MLQLLMHHDDSSISKLCVLVKLDACRCSRMINDHSSRISKLSIMSITLQDAARIHISNKLN